MNEEFEAGRAAQAAQADAATASGHGTPPPAGGAGYDPVPETTGEPLVDEVLASMAELGRRPVDEHVAIFETAHERLRAALAEAGDRPGGPARG